MSRAAALIIENSNVALIKRERGREGKVYYLFPGGKVEGYETVEEACIREIKEELGLDIVIDRPIAEVVFHDNVQTFFLCGTATGTFGSGTGEEYQPGLPESVGTYEPIWMKISDLSVFDVRPACICEMIMNGFPDNVKKFTDLGNGICVES